MNAQHYPADAALITPSDTAEVYFVAIRVGVAGNLAVRTENGTTLTIPNVAAGETIKLRVTKVLATGTTATGLVGFEAQ